MRYVGAISVPSLPGTWETLVRGLPEDLTHDLSGLAGLLEDKVGSLTVFRLNPEVMQICLTHVLGENSPLVTENSPLVTVIIEHVMATASSSQVLQALHFRR